MLKITRGRSVRTSSSTAVHGGPSTVFTSDLTTPEHVIDVLSSPLADRKRCIPQFAH